MIPALSYSIDVEWYRSGRCFILHLLLRVTILNRTAILNWTVKVVLGLMVALLALAAQKLVDIEGRPLLGRLLLLLLIPRIILM